MMEPRDKRERFVALAERRVTRALEAIQAVGKLSNKAIYEYSDHDVAKIIGALNTELTELKRKFSSGDPRDRVSFRL